MYETKDMSKEIKIDPFGFREYDARWIYEKDINKLGIENLGKGLGTQIIKHTKKIIQELSLVTIIDLIVKK
jgi:phosphomannomutase